MDTQYQHSVKVPTQYKKAAKVLKNSMEQRGASLKTLIFSEKHAKTNRMYALIDKISRNKGAIDQILERTQIFTNEPRLDKYLCYVLVTELLFGAKQLNGDSKPVQCIRSYEDKFKQILAEIGGGDSNASGYETGKRNPFTAGSETTTATADTTSKTLKGNGKPRYIRVNTNLLKRAEALEAFVADGWIEVNCETYDEYLNAVANLTNEQFVSDIHVKNLFVFPASSKRYWALNAMTKESKLILQDKASCLPSFLLNPARGSVVLDMCAAPGMKTSHLAAIMKNRGTIYAIENSRTRYERLKSFMGTTNAKIVQCINADVLSIDPSEYSNVEYILLDPPCSGSGMTNRLNIFDTNESSEDRLQSLGYLQGKMLTFAMQNFPNAKKIIYSTCSINVEENEQVIQNVLQYLEGTDWKLTKPLDFAEQWKNFGSPKYKHIGKKCLYARSDIDHTDGFFVAIFERELNAAE